MDIGQKIAVFFAKYPLHTLTKRELLLRAEEPIHDVFYLVSGRISQYDITATGNEVVVNVFKPGAFFPMSSAINDVDNHYFFEASTDEVSVRTAPAAEAVQFLRDNPDVTFALLSRVYRGVDGVLRRMAHLMGGDAETRLIFEILNATARFGETHEDGSVAVALSENDIARHSGLARETVNRVLQGLKADGLVTVGRGKLIVPSTEKLEERLGTKV